MKRSVLLIALLAGCATELTEEDKSSEYYYVPQSSTSGGFVDSYIQRLEQLNSMGTEVRITTNSCTSACTFFLGADKVCIDPKTRFHFHGPSANISLIVPPVHHMMKEKDRKESLEKMKVVYDRWPGLGDWFMEHAASKFGLLTTDIVGQSLHNSFNIPLCEE